MVKLNAKRAIQETGKKKKLNWQFCFLTYLCQTEHAITTAQDIQRYRKLLYRDSIEPQIESPKYISKGDYKRKM